MKTRLYDFTLGGMIVAIIDFVILFGIFGYNFITSDSKVRFGIALAVTAAALVFIVIRYMFITAVIEDERIVNGKFSISRKDMRVITKYDMRFSTSVILIMDDNIDYASLERKEKEKNMIILQATRSNCKKISNFIGSEITPAPKPKHSFFKRR